MTIQRTATFALGALVALAAAAPLHAQRSGDGYLFHAPDAQITIRGGYDRANAKSDVFAQSIDLLTIDKSDFSGINVGAEIGFPVTSRLELSFDASYSHASKGSEFRHFIDNNDKPIEQTTTFDRVPLTGNVRFYLVPPGRTIGKLAWIPAKVVPWIGAGAGMMYYRFLQTGDFVDFQTTNVFPSTFESSKWTSTVNGMGGTDITLSPHLALRAEARYVWAKADLSRSFAGFDRIDLSGVQGTLGLTYRL
ncbi:MAG: outer membrane beta-barrel protein [bacterium]